LSNPIFSQTSTNLTSILDELERLLEEAESGRDSPELKKRILSLLSNLENAIRRMIDERLMVKPTGQTITAVIQALDPIFQTLSLVRLCVKNNRWKDALECLDKVENEKGEIIPGLRESILRGESALMIAAQGFKETAMTISSAPISPPSDLIFGTPAIIIPLYNMLVRERKIEKEDARRRVLPPEHTPEQESEFEYAWSLLESKGYAELQVDKKGKQYLVYSGG